SFEENPADVLQILSASREHLHSEEVLDAHQGNLDSTDVDERRTREELLLESRRRDYQIERQARGPVDEWKQPTVREVLLREGKPEREATGVQLLEELLHTVFCDVHGDVDIGGQPRTAIGDRGLRSKDVPAPPARTHQLRQIREELNRRGAGHDAEP